MAASAPLRWALAMALAAAGAGCRAAPDDQAEPPKRPLGLMTTLPLYWAEANGVAELLKAREQSGWVREALETHFRLEPLDVLEEQTLARMEHLVLAQPRALSPVENVALDRWVRDGGRLLLFADPMLTRESQFGMGDKRRPQDAVLLSPILTRWGLALAFDPAQPAAERMAATAAGPVPVALSGTLTNTPDSACEVSGDRVLAQCRISKGRVTILADAATLDDPENGEIEQRRAALASLTARAFD